MPRTVEISLPSEQTGRVIERLRGLDGVVGLAVQRGSSIEPPGDVVTVHATNGGTRAVLGVLADLDIADGTSILTSQPRSLIAPQYQNGINRESNETIWDEMAFLLRGETNISANYLSLMALSGAVAAVGLWTDTLHIVIGAMVIAPGFEPLLRIPFGFVGGPRVLASRGLLSTVLGYLLLAAGAALMLLVLRAVDSSRPSDLTTRFWVQYWSSATPIGAILALAAGAAGAVTITAQRSVLSAGVMIALALIPAMSITGMGLIAGDWGLAGQGLLRWLSDAGAVLAAGFVVLGLKHFLVHRRGALS